ncbi:copper ion binding protein [Paenibacillus sp. IHBB 10380]|uniref:copper ion binding protein n=1 Tax=Paenibacillus sp. IHBB 10380 TaxID=1566358 RepID=UPI0005CF934D|nr:copper ion binding protein [Paenibacillus sp. IHBB 10380]AJS60990.1 copper resistance protein CopZ [Paenibacillus sp. IHBB 10380]
MQQATLKVEGMSCNHCLNAVEGAVKSVGAVGKVNLELKNVTVEYDDTKVNLDTIKEAIVNQGYDVV